MALVDVVNIKNKKVGEVELSEDVFNVKINPGLLHATVRVQQINRRSGCAATKGRSEVSGGGAKPWKQKGTGRARAGTASSPVWVGGGTVFGPKSKQYNLSINKKAKKIALKSALSLKYQEKSLIILDSFKMSEVKTKVFSEILKTLGVDKSLVVLAEDDRFVDLSSRNIAGVKVLKSEGINAYDILNHQTLVMTKDSANRVEEVLGK